MAKWKQSHGYWLDHRWTIHSLWDGGLHNPTSYFPWLLQLKWHNLIVFSMEFFDGTMLWYFIRLQLLRIVRCKHSYFYLLNLQDLCDDKAAKCDEWESPLKKLHSWDSLDSASVELFSYCLLYCDILCLIRLHLHDTRDCASYSWPFSPDVHLLHLCQAWCYR